MENWYQCRLNDLSPVAQLWGHPSLVWVKLQCIHVEEEGCWESKKRGTFGLWPYIQHLILTEACLSFAELIAKHGFHQSHCPLADLSLWIWLLWWENIPENNYTLNNHHDRYSLLAVKHIKVSKFSLIH